MRIKLTESERYSADAPKYLNGLIFVQSGTENCDIENMAQWLRRLCKKHNGLSSMLISSNHEAKEEIKRSVIHTGMRGRPKTIVTGSAAVAHVHGAIINENPDTNIEAVKEALTSYCRKRRKKRSDLKQQKIKRAWDDGLPVVSYMTRQMNETKPYMAGNFNFMYYDDIRYCMYPQEDNDVIVTDEEDDDIYDDILEI